MSYHICPGLDGTPTILCFNAQAWDVFTAYRSFMERKSGGPIRLVMVAA